jgi:hypothetical protein
MCYNAPTSIIYFGIISIIIVFLWMRNKGNDRWFALFFTFANMVQLGEFFIWTGLGNKNKSMNLLGSKLIKLSIYAQPLAITLGAKFLGKIDKKYDTIINVLAVVYGVLFGIEVLRALVNPVVPSRQAGHHLTWNNNLFNDTLISGTFLSFIYAISFFIIFFQKDKIQALFIVAFVYLALAVNYFSLKNNTWQSMWCFVGNFTPVLYLLMTR